MQAEKQYTVPQIELRRRPVYAFFKRFFDILFSVIGLIVAALPMAIIALIVRFDSGSPVIFKQTRLGKGKRPFTVYKFRTMRHAPHVKEEKWADIDDARVTRVGRILRKSHLDELPQLWNILKGEMSFVGPRPETPGLHEEFCSYIDGFDQRCLVTPGLTGWAQVNGGYDLPPEEKIRYDVAYIEHRSPFFDFYCMLLTVGAVLTGKGAR